MKTIRKLTGILILGILFTSNSIFAQSINDFVMELRKKIDAYIIANPQDNIYLHTDRTIYFPGESVLFHATVTEATNLQLSGRSKKCVISLKDSKGEQVIHSSYNLVNGYVSGSFVLPANSVHGAFCLEAGISSQDERLLHKRFTKDIFITDPANLLMIDYTLNQKEYKSGDELRLSLNAYGPNSKNIAGISYSYRIFNGDEQLYEGEGKSSKEGAFTFQYDLPIAELSGLFIDVKAVRRKVTQHFTVEIPLVKEKKALRNADDIKIIFGETNDRKITTSLEYSKSGFDGSKEVIISIFRKGLLYFYAPIALEKATDLPLPVQNIPSGILDVVLFSEDGSFLNDRLIYFEREDMPKISVQLDKESYGKRQLVTANILFSRENSAIPEGTHLSVSVAPIDMVPSHEMLLDDQLLINSDLILNDEKCISMTRGEADRQLWISELLKSSYRNGYDWNQLLDGVGTLPISAGKVLALEDKIPAWFNASRINDLAIGIVDSRLPSDDEQSYKIQLRNGVSLLDVIKQMKPYNLENNSKIVFTRSKNSLYNQQGALIVVDNQLLGDDASILNSVVPSHVESIKISTSPGDILQYSGNNSVGVIIIKTKHTDDEALVSDETPRDDLIRDSFDSYLPGYPDYSLERDINSVSVDNRTLLFWEPFQQFSNTGETRIKFYTGDLQGDYIITVQGMVGVYPVAVRQVFQVN